MPKIIDGLYQESVAMLNHADKDFPDTDFILWLTPEFKPIEDPRVVYFPIPDDPNGLSMKVFWTLYGICNTLKGLGSVTTVCTAGENRSGLASAMILIGVGKSVEETIELIRETVPPNSHADYALWNPGFVQQLEDNF